MTINTLLAELGDWTRFHSGNAVVAFAGLNPGVRESDKTRYDLKLTKAGSPLLRWIMIQLAHRMKRTTMRWKTTFERLAIRVGKKKATCAIARRLLLVIYAMLRDGAAYQPPAISRRLRQLTNLRISQQWREPIDDRNEFSFKNTHY